MIGGFVHQLRTPLHLIQSSAEDLSKQRRFMPTFKPQAELIARSAQRMEAAVNALLSFVRGDQPNLQPASVNTVIDQLGDFLKDECRKRSVTVEKHLGSQRCVLLDAFPLQEALINLIMNALQAMPQGGLLTLRTEDIPSQKKVLVEVKDTGHGMDKKTLARIAKPFQTTKQTGMGLGVFFTRKILTQHHADLTLASEKGRGTTATIVFPAV
jgi:signal transduction histidine kinase